MASENSGYSFRHVLRPSAAGQSTIEYLVEQFRHSTREQWLARIQAQEVRVNGMIANGAERLKPGGILIWDRPGWAEEEVPSGYQILYRDEVLLAVDKPSGLPTLPGAGFYQNTLLTQVQIEHPTAIPLHRLGRATSGIVLFAYDRRTSAEMTKRWAEVQKEYRTVVQGIATFDSICIRTPIGLIPHPRLGEIFGASWAGKASRSMVNVLQRSADDTLCSVQIMTGRPHQIRIHLASVGHPLLGDPVYGPGGGIVEVPGLPGDAGYVLHAHRMQFRHPTLGLDIAIEAPLPVCLR